MKKMSAALIILVLMLPGYSCASVNVLAGGWWDASIEELLIAREQIDAQITALGGSAQYDGISSEPTHGQDMAPNAASTETPSILSLADEAQRKSQGESLDKQFLEFQSTLNDTGAALRAMKDTKKYSYSEEEVWQYCMDRWDYYDRLNGGYAGDKYTSQVFKDAGKRFGISAAEAEKIWDKVDKSKYGLK